jgi:RND superfamily putative drug exporter
VVAGVGRWSAGHPWRAIALWLTFVVAAVASLQLAGNKTLQSSASGESKRGYAIMKQHHVRGPAQFDYAYVRSDTLHVGDPAFRSAVAAVKARMASTLRARVTVRSGGDGHAVLLTARATQEFSAVRPVLTAAAADHPQLTIGGDGPGGGSSSTNDLHRAEKLALPVTLFVLLIAFGSLVAALVPVLLGLTAVVATFGLLGPISHLFALDSSVKVIVLLLGMAVGVDYALFYVVRSREERMHGLPTKDALDRTAQTSGRTVVIAGATVAIAMAGQYIIGSPIFNGIASGTIAVVACAVAGSVTVLPAVLELLGTRIDRGRIPFLPHPHTDTSKSRFWPAVVDRVMRRPALFLAAGTALLVALAVPALRMHITEPASDTLKPRSDAGVVAQIYKDFPGTSAPAVLAVSFPRGMRTQIDRDVRSLEASATARGIAHPPYHVTRGQYGDALVVALPLTGSGDNSASRSAIETLRSDLVPAAFPRVPGVQAAVTGIVAEDVDFTHEVKHGIGYVMAFVLGLPSCSCWSRSARSSSRSRRSCST